MFLVFLRLLEYPLDVYEMTLENGIIVDRKRMIQR